MGLALIFRLLMFKIRKGPGASVLGLVACNAAWAATACACLTSDAVSSFQLACAAFCTLMPGRMPPFFALGALACFLPGTPVLAFCTVGAGRALLGAVASVPALAGILARRWLNPSLLLPSGSLCALAEGGCIADSLYDPLCCPVACTLAGLAIGAALFFWGAGKNDPVPGGTQAPEGGAGSQS